jgi:cell wall assembly regulator SMI1
VAEITHPWGLTRTTEEAITAAESTLSVRFPEDYRRFLLEHNGGATVPNGILVGEVNQFAIVDRLFDVAYILSYFEEVRDELAQGLVPTGVDPGGNMLLMDLSENGQASVYSYDVYRVFKESTDSENTYLGAKSFSEFLNMLRPLPEEA